MQDSKPPLQFSLLKYEMPISLLNHQIETEGCKGALILHCTIVYRIIIYFKEYINIYYIKELKNVKKED